MYNPFEDIIWLHDMEWGKQNFIHLGGEKFLSILLEHGHMVEDRITKKIVIKHEPQYVRLNCAFQIHSNNIEFREFTELDEYVRYMDKHSSIRQELLSSHKA